MQTVCNNKKLIQVGFIAYRDEDGMFKKPKPIWVEADSEIDEDYAKLKNESINLIASHVSKFLTQKDLKIHE